MVSHHHEEALSYKLNDKRADNSLNEVDGSSVVKTMWPGIGHELIALQLIAIIALQLSNCKSRNNSIINCNGRN